MITSLECMNVNDAFVTLCKEAIKWPIEVRRGGNKMMDSPGPVVTEIMDPRDRVLNISGRNNSLPAACAETLWVLAGRSDVEWLKFYLSRAPDFSDDGKVWRAGYGPRLRYYSPDHNDVYVDQLKFVIDELKALPNSRRAAISLIDPTSDSKNAPVEFKDFPCNLTLSFMIRYGKLDLVVFCRSQDLVWGASGINWFEFTVMQELVARMIGVEIGSYYHVTNNLHVYDRHFKMVQRIALSCDPYPHWVQPDYHPGCDTLLGIDLMLERFFALEYDIRIKSPVKIDQYEIFNGRSLVGDLCAVALAYCAYKSGDVKLEHELQSRIIDNAMWNSYRRYKIWLQHERIKEFTTPY